MTIVSRLRSAARAAQSLTAALRSDRRTTTAVLKNLPAVIDGAALADHWPSADTLAAPSSQPNRLRDYFDKNVSGPGIWKWEHYFDAYDRHLSSLIGTSPKVVEVGIYSGGSLGMWLDYFGAGSHIHGVDIEPACTSYASDHVSVHIGDQADRSFWAKFRQSTPAVDVLIDDGGHTDEQQIVTLEEMLPHLQPGGVYICEDIHGANRRVVAFAHGLVDRLNRFKPDTGDVLTSPVSPFQQAVHSIHVYPYLLVIEKHHSGPAEFRAPRHGTEWQPFYDR